MFSVVYRFEILKENYDAFVESWFNMTAYLYQNKGAKGSRLHQMDETTFFAYAQWPSKAVWETNRHTPTEASKALSLEMKKYMLKSETLFYGEVVKDALIHEAS